MFFFLVSLDEYFVRSTHFHAYSLGIFFLKMTQVLPAKEGSAVASRGPQFSQ